MASEQYTRWDDVVLVANRAHEFNKGKSSRGQPVVPQNFDERPTKKLMDQNYHPPPPRYQGGGPQSSRNQTSNTNYQKSRVQTCKNLKAYLITKSAVKIHQKNSYPEHWRWSTEG